MFADFWRFSQKDADAELIEAMTFLDEYRRNRLRSDGWIAVGSRALKAIAWGRLKIVQNHAG